MYLFYFTAQPLGTADLSQKQKDAALHAFFFILLSVQMSATSVAQISQASGQASRAPGFL
jgi:hypothetical protein